MNRNKRSVWLDLSIEADREHARDLAPTADVLVENFIPGTMARFGLGSADVCAGNPGIVYASIPGFGAGAGLPCPETDELTGSRISRPR